MKMNKRIASGVMAFVMTASVVASPITAFGAIVCGKEEHTHTAACETTGTSVLTCTTAEHTHSTECNGDSANPCTQTEHTHNANCYVEGAPVLTCTKEEHTHNSSCEGADPEPSEEPVVTPEPESSVNINGNVYVSNYAVVDANGNTIAKLNPGDKCIIAVNIVDERIPSSLFTESTGRVHPTMGQGAFSLSNANNINVRIRENGSGNLCYTLEFRDVTYLGGTPSFSFTVGYSAPNGAYDKVPFSVPQFSDTIQISQAVDDVVSPQIILNSANYGGTVTAGSTFTLSTVAQNTSDALELENVTVRIILPNGLSMAGGNSQVLVGKVGKRGTIAESFTLVADNMTTESATLPVQLEYTFEALVGGKRTQFKSVQDISVNVAQPTRFTIQDSRFDDEMYLGDTGYGSVSIVNKGKSSVYNVTVEIISDDLYGAEVEFVGNMTSGTQKELDFSFYAKDLGTANGKIVVTYEDSTGKEQKLEKEFSIEVMEQYNYDPGYEDIDPDPIVTEKKSVLPYVIAGVVAVGGVAALMVMKKKKAARLAELEDDEDI